jgi:integrase
MAIAFWNEKDQRWRINVVIKGVRRQFSSSKPGKAGEIAVNKKYTLALQGVSEKTGWKLQTCWELYLEEVKALTSYSNYAQRETYGRIYILPRLGLKRMGDITDQDWQDCITKAKPKDRIRKAVLSRKTLSNLRATIMGFCKFAVRSRMIDRMPSTLRLPTTAPKEEKGILLPKQLQKLFEPSGEWYINAWRIMVVTGLRPGEAYALQRQDLKDGVLYVKRSINAHLEVTPGKNTNAKRWIVLHPIGEQIIADQLEKLRHAKIASPWLFPDRDGSSPNPRNAYKQWTHFRTRNGISIPPYGLRHTFVSLTQHSLPESMLRQVVGHSEAMDTYGVYGHVVDGDMREASTRIYGALQKWITPEME